MGVRKETCALEGMTSSSSAILRSISTIMLPRWGLQRRVTGNEDGFQSSNGGLVGHLQLELPRAGFFLQVVIKINSNLAHQAILPIFPTV